MTSESVKLSDNSAGPSSLNSCGTTLAEELANARAQGQCLALPTQPKSLQEAYQIQERVSQILGGEHRGWKVGSTSKAAQARLGTSEPGAGRLLSPFVFEDGAEVPVSTQHDVQLEVEFAFIVGETLRPRDQPYAMDEVRAAMDSFVPGIEVVGSRYCSGLAGAGPELVTADGGANIAFVYGPSRPLSPDDDLAHRPCQLIINGEQAANGIGANALDGPFNVLLWLANHLSNRGMTLEAGHLVTTGTCTGLIAAAPGDKISGRFGELGSVSFALSEL